MVSNPGVARDRYVETSCRSLQGHKVKVSPSFVQKGSLLETRRPNEFGSAYHDNGASCEILAAEELVVLAELQRPVRSLGSDNTSEISESPLLFQISCDPAIKIHTV
ncbi:hypothetical protein RvY_09576 [Ramazzottius varieornatus]|uniref:Uncharacterized protein n=1 Tax=Ramazzottius varieornatus TaxID=947166 RepID=A0A1D1V9W3_RAMVA|nr:hypothetical protein RvY_09576 [Ramazzottius varieornatus]